MTEPLESFLISEEPPAKPIVEKSDKYSRTSHDKEISGKINYSVTINEGNLEIPFNVQEADKSKVLNVKIEKVAPSASPDQILKDFGVKIEKEVENVKKILEGSKDDFDSITLSSPGRLAVHGRKRKELSSPPEEEVAEKPVLERNPEEKKEPLPQVLEKPIFIRKSVREQVRSRKKPVAESPKKAESPKQDVPVKRQKVEEVKPTVQLTAAQKSELNEAFNQVVSEVQNKLHAFAESQGSYVDKCQALYEFMIEKRQQLIQYLQQKNLDIEVLSQILQDYNVLLANQNFQNIVVPLEQALIGKLVLAAGEKPDENFRSFLSVITDSFTKCKRNAVDKDFIKSYELLSAYRVYIECQTKKAIREKGVDNKIKQEVALKTGEIFTEVRKLYALSGFIREMVSKESLPDLLESLRYQLVGKNYELTLLLPELDKTIKSLVDRTGSKTLAQLDKLFELAQKIGNSANLNDANAKIRDFFGEKAESFDYKGAILILPLYEKVQNALIELFTGLQKLTLSLREGCSTNQGVDFDKLNKKHSSLLSGKCIQKETFNSIGMFGFNTQRYTDLEQYITQKFSGEVARYELFLKDFLTLYPENVPDRKKILESYIRFKLAAKLQEKL